MSRYALEFYSCKQCGFYPITRIQRLPPPKEEPLVVCPRCGSHATLWQKARACDENGRVTE